jgi:hypothetical protein
MTVRASWVHPSRPATTGCEVADVLDECIGLIDTFVEMFGPCDHAENVCVCYENGVSERARRARAILRDV